MSLPENLKQEAIRKYGRKFLFIYPKHNMTLEDLYCEGAVGKRTNGYYAVCSSCGCKYDYDDPLPGMKAQIRIGYGCGVVDELEKEARAETFTECLCCGERVEKKKGWYGKAGLKDRFYLQAWEVHSPEHVTLHECIIALDDWNNYRDNGGAKHEIVYYLQATELTPGLSETWKRNSDKPRRFSAVASSYEACGACFTLWGAPMASRGCYMGFEKLRNTFLRPFLEAVEKDPALTIEDYASYIIRMNEEPMTELLFKAGFKEIAKERVYKTSSSRGTLHMDFTARSPKKFFRGLKKNSAENKMKQLMRIVYPKNITAASLETAAARFRDNPSEKPEEMRFIVEAGTQLKTFNRILEFLPAFGVRRIGEYLAEQREKNIEAFYYRDYLEAAHACGAPLNEAKTAFPKNLRKAHDDMIKKRQFITDQKECEKFKKRHSQLVAAGFEYEHNGIYAVVPKEASEVIAEGKKLHHCVGGYVKRVANGDSNIIFIRHKDNKSWFTLEIDPKTLEYKQCYGEHNKKTGLFRSSYSGNYDPEVGKFLYHYRRHLTWAAKNLKGAKTNGKQHSINHGAA